MIKLSDLMGNGGMMFMLEKKKGVKEDDEIIIPQIGRMLFSQLKKNVEGKAKDLYDRIKKGQYDRISDSMLELFSHFVRVARSYQKGEKVPSSTLFKESSEVNELTVQRTLWSSNDLKEYQQRYGKTNIIISGIEKGEASRVFRELSKDVDHLPKIPKEIRINF